MDDIKVDRLAFICRNIQETIGIDEIKEKIDNNVTITGYWGTAPTKAPSIAYLIPLMKVADMVVADIDMKILIADVHAFLDSKSDVRIDEQTNYYIFLIRTILDNLGIEECSYSIIQGSDVQLDKKYVLDLLKLLTKVTVNQAKHAGNEVVKQSKETSLASLIYPIMQAIDETVLEADIELGGMDQRKIFTLSRDIIGHLNHPKCAYLMNELLPSLCKKNKMSSSDVEGKIEFTDSLEIIAGKLRKAFCAEKEVKDNPCMALARLIVYPMNRKLDKYETYLDLEHDWMNGTIWGLQLKQWLTVAIDDIIAPIRKKVEENIELYNLAYS
jgi:tyrosyl-tRNA synthetase